MRYPASEKPEIIRLVEGSHLPAKHTLDKLGIPRTAFYRWYARYLSGGPEALEDRSPGPCRAWNRIPEPLREKIKDLARVVGQGAAVDMLLNDIQAELKGRPYELVQVAAGWMFRTRPQFAGAIKAVADLGDASLPFSEMEMAVLGAGAYHQPIDRAGLVDIFGKEINRDLLARLRYEDLIATGPRSPRPGAPHTFVTTETFLAMFDLQSLRDLPELQLGLDEGSAESMVESVWRPNGSGLYLSVAGTIPAPFSRISSAGRRNVYVMDNHRAALWCWLQELDLKQPHSLIHIDRHPDALQSRLDEWLRHLPDWSAGIDAYLAKTYETDGFDCPVIRWGKYLSIYLHAPGKNLKVFRVHRQMIWDRSA